MVYAPPMLVTGSIQKKISFGRSSYCSVLNAHECAMKMLKSDCYAMVRPKDNFKV